MYAAEVCGGKFIVEGLGNMEGRTPCVFVSNHMSSLETFVLPTVIIPFGDVTYVVKESLFRYPVLGHMIKAIRPVAVRRTDPRRDLKDVLTEGVRRLQEGMSMIVFPQATRTEVFDMNRFNSLGVKLASRAGVPLVPVAVKTDYLVKGRILKDFGLVDPSKTIHLRFGPPIAEFPSPAAQHRQTMDFIADSLEEWGARVVRKSD